MKLLLDENLSRRIVPFLQIDFPGTSQVAVEGMVQVGAAETLLRDPGTHAPNLLKGGTTAASPFVPQR